MKRGTPRHPKVGQLAELLGVNIPTAVGLLEMLWHFTAEFAPQGDIGKYDDDRIEAALLSWFRPKGKLILALIQASWIDQDEVSRLIVHDWCDHADAQVKKRLDRAGLQFVAVTPKVTGQREALSQTMDVLPLPLPLPSLAIATPVPDFLSLQDNTAPKKTPSAELCPEAPMRGITRWRNDAGFIEFVEAYRAIGGPLTDADCASAYFIWPKLDFIQKRAAFEHVQTCEGAHVKLIHNYLESREWTRPERPAPKTKLERLMESV